MALTPCLSVDELTGRQPGDDWNFDLTEAGDTVKFSVRGGLAARASTSRDSADARIETPTGIVRRGWQFKTGWQSRPSGTTCAASDRPDVGNLGTAGHRYTQTVLLLLSPDPRRVYRPTLDNSDPLSRDGPTGREVHNRPEVEDSIAQPTPCRAIYPLRSLKQCLRRRPGQSCSRTGETGPVHPLSLAWASLR